METAVFPLAIVALYGLGIIASVVIIVYLIVKRIEDKKKETFEDRDN